MPTEPKQTIRIIGLEDFGYKLMNDVSIFVSDTDQPKTNECRRNIYYQAVYQCFSEMNKDYRTFLINLHHIPDWRTMNYTEQDPSGEGFKKFASSVRAFGVCLYNHLLSTGQLHENTAYIMESCSTSTAVIQAVQSPPLPSHLQGS